MLPKEKGYCVYVFKNTCFLSVSFKFQISIKQRQSSDIGYDYFSTIKIA